MYKFFFFLFLTLFFVGCSSYNDKKDSLPSFLGDIVDNATWYSDESSVVSDVNVSIPVPNSALCAPYNNTTAPLRPCTLDDVNNDINPDDNYQPTLAVKFFTPDFPLANEQTNAIFKQKGKSTRLARQKSYKVKMNSKTNLWRDDRRLQFNKQYYDLTRIRNKLSFDLFEDIPNFPSLKTEFVHLFIDGDDYGLFTKVESYDKDYLVHRGWNQDDNLYKAQNFSFRMSDNLKLDANGHPINLDAFEKSIGINRGKEQTKFIEMLTAVNDYSISIDTIISKYFNRKNYITWFAVNILTENIDTMSQNFFLLNPLHSNTFYFLPWDYDGGWSWDTQPGETRDIRARWQMGLARWWGSTLHQRFISVKKNRDDIDAMVQYLHNTYFTKEIIDKKVNAYKALIAPYILKLPDVAHLPYNDSNITKVREVWEAECDRLSSTIETNIQAYEDMKSMPMPFWQNANYVNGLLSLEWDKSVDFNADTTIAYDIQISDSPDFNTTLVSVNDYNDTKYTKTINLPPKQYYMKVIAKERDNPSNYQIAFDEYSTYDAVNHKDTYYHGVLAFEVK